MGVYYEDHMVDIKYTMGAKCRVS